MCVWWTDLVAPTVSGLIVAVFSIRWSIRNENKKNEMRFNNAIRRLSRELESNSKGRGGPEGPPFQVFWLQNVLQSCVFAQKYPHLFEKAAKCLDFAGGRLGTKPSETQVLMRELKDLIDKEILEPRNKLHNLTGRV